MQERCPTRLLPDTPADTDSFGSHERVAHSIAEVVQTESGGKAIGLEGGWGSGKSTIVKLISRKLSQHKENFHKIAVFDMWSHQGDPLRRTFLENLVTQVRGFGWVNKEKWNQRIAELARRRREDTTRIVPSLTRAGGWFAFTLLAIPIGAALIGAGLSLLGSKDASATLGIVLLPLGIIIALAPAIYFGGFLAWTQIWRRIRGGGRSAEDGGLSELPALVTGQSSTESRTVVTQTPDPTSVEFESMFRDLLDEALKPKNHTLLIVVDNLDRVEPSDALSIWATLQTFLSYSDYQRPDWIDRLWVLIPYDADAIVRLWDRLGSDATQPASSSLATSFLDKTFQLRFRVPPLLLSNWREFLQEALQQAFPNHEETDFHGVYRAFAARGGLERSAPTPRQLKMFVNQIGALHREWQDQFPLSHLACYVLFQTDQKDVREALLSNSDFELLSESIGRDWRGVIAALHFGVPVEEARQLLLREPIQVALNSGDGKALAGLLSVHHTGFWSVLEDTVPAGAKDWSSLVPPDLAKAATAILNSRIFDHSDDLAEAAALRSAMRTAATSTQAWAPFDDVSAAGIVAMAELVGNSDEVVAALLAAASNAPVEASEEERRDGDVSPIVWMSSALTVIEGLVKLGLVKQMTQVIKVPLGAEQWLDVSGKVVENDPDGRLLQHFDLRDIEEIDELLAQRVVPGQINEDSFNAVRTAMATKSSNDMKNVTDVVFSHLESGGGIQADELAFMLKILRWSRLAGLIQDGQYGGFAANGHFLHHLYQAASENHSEAVAECMFGYLEAVPDASLPSQVGNSNTGHERLVEILENPDTVPGAVEHFTVLAKETQQLQVVFKMTSKGGSTSPFVAKSLHALLTSKEVPKPPDLVSENWAAIREVLREGEESSESFEAFLKDLPGIDNLVAGVLGETFDVQESALYLALLRSSTSTDIVAWCVTGLSSVSQDAWTEAITSQGDLLDLVKELKTHGVNIVLGATYHDALVNYAEQVSDGSERALTKESWSDLFTLLDSNRRELFHRRAYEILKDSKGEASAEYFALFGDILLSDSSILAGDHRFIDEVCRPILYIGTEDGIAWMAEVAEADASLFTNSSDPAAASDFADRVRQSLTDTLEDDPRLPHLKRIGTALAITGEASNTDENPQSGNNGETRE